MPLSSMFVLILIGFFSNGSRYNGSLDGFDFSSVTKLINMTALFRYYVLLNNFVKVFNLLIKPFCTANCVSSSAVKPG